MIDAVKSNLHPSLEDDETCGEDLFLNAERVLQLAPALCDGCRDYHVRTVLHRTARFPKGIKVDRPQIIGGLQPLLAGRRGQPTTLLIAGAADTGILSTCAHAAAALGEDVLRNIRFVVADRCETPLVLCRAFAEEHRLECRTQRCDFMLQDLSNDFDIAVLHSILRFLLPENQVMLLAKLKQRLKPGGTIMVSHRVIGPDHHGEEKVKRGVADGTVLEHISQGRIRTTASLADIETLLQRSRDDRGIRPGELRSEAELKAIISAAGLAIEGVQHVSSEISVTPVTSMRTYRIIALLKAG